MSRKLSRRYQPLAMIVAMVFMLFAFSFSSTAESKNFYDLTLDNEATEKTINGAIWQEFGTADASGTGVFDTFLLMQRNGVQKGYNSDFRPVQFDETSNAGNNRSFPLNKVPVELIDGVAYREFQLDINQAKNSPRYYLSLEKFQIWVTDNPNLTNYNLNEFKFPEGTAELVYDLDGDGDTWIKMDYRINPGSGKRDYRVLIPQSDFAGKQGQYVVLFALHGENHAANAGFEEWGVRVVQTGSLEINKTFLFGDVEGFDKTTMLPDKITVTVTGPSYPLGKDFDLAIDTDGEGSLTLDDLIPGEYTVTEKSLGTEWSVEVKYEDDEDEAMVEANETATVEIENTYETGSLEINKTFLFGDVEGFDKTTMLPDKITVTVTGPSYPLGKDFDLAIDTDGEGSLTLDDLIPGEYTVTEKSLGTEWSVEVKYEDDEDEAMVEANETATVEITNTYIMPDTETAMARMQNHPSEYDYRFDNHPWFSFLIHEPEEEKETFFFYAGQHHFVGYVDIWKENGKLMIDIRLESGYTLEELHINVQTSLSGNPSPQSTAFGRYPYRSGEIEWQSDWDDKDLYITVHGVVSGPFD